MSHIWFSLPFLDVQPRGCFTRQRSPLRSLGGGGVVPPLVLTGAPEKFLVTKGLALGVLDCLIRIRRVMMGS